MLAKEQKEVRDMQDGLYQWFTLWHSLHRMASSSWLPGSMKFSRDRGPWTEGPVASVNQGITGLYNIISLNANNL